MPQIAATPPIIAALPNSAPATGTVIRTCIEGDFTGWSGETVFQLCNGLVFEQASYNYRYAYRYRPNVTLARPSTATPLWTLTVEGVGGTSLGSVTVRQVMSFVQTCISSDFSGWSGDTVFVLCNGQVWQQASYAYAYHYAYRPNAILYASNSGGHVMSVEGMDETIRVVRLR